MEAAGVEWRAQEGGPPFLHPGRAATIVAADGSELGWLGELHPLVLREWELDGPGAAFELDAERLFELAPQASTYSDVTSFPAVLQDIAVIVPDRRVGGAAGRGGDRRRRRAAPLHARVRPLPR